MLKINKIFILFILSFLSFKSYSSLIWFCPNDTDFLNHSNLYYKWDNLSKDISVFKFYSGVIHDAPNDSLRLKAATLNKKNIKISIEIPALTTSSNLNKVEGFESKKYLKDIMEKLKTNKVKISSISLDEPLYYGLYKKNIGSKEEFYKNIADSLSVVWSYYPNVSVVDIEPLSQFKNNYLENNYQDWLSNFYKYTGHHISTLHADLYWEGDYKSDV
ncbi:hypothetical protein, partial [Rosenbergiella epipactidis]|uniref:hypothetical protein n=1 Tax=Rosenbergiella epipactidis TaxID=1544694 RepID=UPI001F502C14